MQHLKFCLKVISLSFFIATTAIASENSCLETIYNFGANYNIEKFEKSGIRKSTSESNPNGETGELLYLNTLTLNEGWVKTLECKSCSPKKSVTELLLFSTVNLPCGLTNKSSEAEIVKKFGPVQERKNDYLIYNYPPIEQTESISFKIEQGKLSAVHWAMGID